MNLGAAVALSILLFAPGFAVFVRLFHAFPAKGAFPAPPAPGSMLALAVVSTGTIVAHALGALALVLNGWLAARGRVLVRWPENPDVYAMLFRGGRNGPALDSGEVFAILLFLLLLSAVAYLLAGWFVSWGLHRKWLESFLYGWTAPIFLSAAPDRRFVTGFVVTKIGHDGRFMAYEGTIENLSLSSDKEVQSLTLVNCSRFMVAISREGIVRRATDRSDVIPRMVISADDIGNIAFEVIEVAAV